MSYQEKILLKNDKIRRKLFDNNIKIMGELVNCLRITLTFDKDFPDDKIMTIESSDNIDLIIDFPGEVLPLYQNISEYGNNINNNQNTFYLYEVLPIKCYSKFEDNLKVGDIIVYKNYNENKIPSPFIFQVTRQNTQFSRVSVWRENIISFYNLDLNQEVRDLINNYMLNENF